MSASATPIGRLRERRRADGLKETTVWLTREADAVVAKLVEEMGLRNRSEAIQYALSRVAAKETQSTN